MLLNNLYYINTFTVNETGENLEATIVLNPKHPVFEGHFPGNPILPGVCTVQIAKEILQKALQKELMLCRAGNIKYLGFINPTATSEVQFILSMKKGDTGIILCTVQVRAGGNLSCSFKAEYTVC